MTNLRYPLGQLHISQLLVRQVPEGKLLAVDVQPEMISLLQLKFRVGAIHELPLL
jgi:hypothetical protein